MVAFSTEEPEGTPYTGPPFVESDPSEVRSKYAGWEEEVQVLLEVSICNSESEEAYLNDSSRASRM